MKTKNPHNKNTRLLALFLVLLTIVLIAVLAGTVFTVKEFLVRFDDTKEPISVLDEQQILNSVDKYIGHSIFTLKDSQIELAIDNAYVYIINIEKVFPSSIILHIAERKEVFAVEYDEGYYMCDSDGTVLRYAETNTNNIYARPNTLVDIKCNQTQIASKLEVQDQQQLAAVLDIFVFYLTVQPPYTTAQIPDIVSKISFNEQAMLIFTDLQSNHIVIELDDYHIDTTTKMQLGWGAWLTSQGLSGTIKVYYSEADQSYVSVITN